MMAPPRLLLLAAAALLGCAHAATDTGGLSRGSFPKGFVFGTATSAFQVEGAATAGGRGPSIWDPFVHTPGNIADNANADVATDEYHRYKVGLRNAHSSPSEYFIYRFKKKIPSTCACLHVDKIRCLIFRVVLVASTITFKHNQAWGIFKENCNFPSGLYSEF
ncbi:unnamed protein product [Triticum turgidum subsp. durum]|uniref:4-hydroxy-7-methoxy-3-oxo-3,4-dihydro-2H-1,4-benzoxazin-2-yl glucosidebeta-D-glucosidase n=1 Tax=Triticum turgidum subsp. durum TaxID=4567 RepID=A0A9R0SIT4_TRITD|nr:unnamed protein product [Triticum turgidum subsp. durum]